MVMDRAFGPTGRTGRPAGRDARAGQATLSTSIRPLLAIAPVLTLLGSCEPAGSDDGSPAPPPVAVRVQSWTPLPPPLVIGVPSDMVYWPRMRSVFVSDHQSGVVFRLGIDDGEGETICRRGDGPTELQRPVALALETGELHIADVGRGRVLTVDEECGFESARPLAATGYGNEASLSDAGSFAEPTGGFDGGLARVLSSDGTEPRLVGNALPLPEGMTPASIRRQVAAGETPTLFENNVLVTQFDDRADVILASLAGAWVARFGPTGEEVWRTEIDLGESGEALMAYYRDLNSSEADERRIHPTEVFADLETRLDHVWVLSSPHLASTHVWQLGGETGRIKRRFVVTGLRHPTEFAILGDSAMLVLGEHGEGLAQLSLPGGEDAR